MDTAIAQVIINRLDRLESRQQNLIDAVEKFMVATEESIERLEEAVDRALAVGVEEDSGY